MDRPRSSPLQHHGERSHAAHHDEELDGFDTIKACVAYKQNGLEINHFPYNIEEGIEPIYKELPGWKTDMTSMTAEEQFPQQFKDYVSFLEQQLETPITIISIGPDREQTILRKK